MIFVLGLTLLWRQGAAVPPAASVASNLIVPAVAPPAPQPPPVVQAPAPVSSIAAAAAQSAAGIEHQVRGSLDELKDTLFRLELRHEAGTISAEDYARERDRIQKTLRDFVKG